MKCEDCGAKFSHMEQTRSEYRDGLCPVCGSEHIYNDYDLTTEKQLEDLKAMREASRIKG